MRIAYADPPYPGCAHYYPENQEVDHANLIKELGSYDGWVLHSSSVALPIIAPLAMGAGARCMAWVKPFAAFKRNVSVAYAWEPVFVKACRKPVVTGRVVMRDWYSQSITLKKGLVGAKPPELIRWAFEMVGAEPTDELVDLFPGTRIVELTWAAWRAELEDQGIPIKAVL